MGQLFIRAIRNWSQYSLISW